MPVPSSPSVALLLGAEQFMPDLPASLGQGSDPALHAVLYLSFGCGARVDKWPWREDPSPTYLKIRNVIRLFFEGFPDRYSAASPTKETTCIYLYSVGLVPAGDRYLNKLLEKMELKIEVQTVVLRTQKKRTTYSMGR